MTVVGVIADRVGAAAQWETVAANHPGRNFDVRHVFSSVPSTEYRSVQAGVAGMIRVDIDHGRVVGEVKHLELRQDGKLYAVTEIDATGLDQGPWYFSPEILHRNGRDIELRAVAVTKKPASVALGPIEAFPGTLHQVASTIVYQDGYAGQLIKRADETDRKRRRGEPLEVHGAAAPTTPAPALSLPTAHCPDRVPIRPTDHGEPSPPPDRAARRPLRRRRGRLRPGTNDPRELREHRVHR